MNHKMRVLVTGVTGNIGWGVARALLSQGHTVLATARDMSKLAELSFGIDRPGKIEGYVVDFADQTSVASFAQRILVIEPFEHAFVALGGWWQKGPLTAQSPAEYTAVRGMLLDCQVHAAMSILPALERIEASSYTMVTGAGALTPIPGTSLLHVAMGGVLALSRVLRDEHQGDTTRVNELMISTRIERQPRNGVVAAEDFGRAIVPIFTQDHRSSIQKFDAAGLISMAS